MNVSFASAPARNDRPNEDWVGATSRAVVLLDGITSPSALGPSSCRHGVPWFVARLGTCLLELLEAPDRTALRAVLGEAIARVAELHADTCDLAAPDTPAATVALLRIDADAVDCLVLSDASIVLDTLTGIQVITDDRPHVAADLKAATLREPLGTPEHQQRRLASIAEQRRHRNVPGGYWVAAADPHAVDHAHTTTVPRAELRSAALLSDGAARLAAWEVTDWPGVLDTLQHAGPAELIHQTRTAEATDPEGRRWPRFKHRDDVTAAYVAL